MGLCLSTLIKIPNFINVKLEFIEVAEGLACGTPHMISATIDGLALLAYEFSDLVFNC
ncbi:hypothetical protein RchiOBHm_Chr2g0121761 [Rosa chinensis]|uniref:Uncharacterized protein n=1 Tax=Rosa chinensis TaxID=74649 RepID=A0A2P6RSM2_ROSCH|nr:hypothetical protein RchiOBHm_Chr2g0121761 [Rosa chinensis]